MCLHVDTSSFLLFNVASLGLYNIKYFSQVHNEHYLPTGEMVFFQYAPLDAVCDVTVLQLPYMFTKLCSIAITFVFKGG